MVLVSSGAIAAGLAPLGLARRPRALAAQQAAASVGQGLLVHRYTEELARHGIVVGQVLLTVDDVTRRAHYRNAHQTFAKLLELGVLPIVNENDTVATTEIRFGDNDRLAALVAAPRPRRPAGAAQRRRRPLRRQPGRRAGLAGVRRGLARPTSTAVRIGSTGGAGLGSGGMVTKVESARIATGAGIPVVLTSAPQRRGRAGGGGPVGTLFHATGRRRPTRLLWLAHATDPRGRLVLDAGAVRAVVERRASLLAAGVTGGRGQLRRRRPRRPDRLPTGGPSPAAWSTSTPPSCRRCWAAPRTTSSGSSARPTSGRSCTATTSCCCEHSPDGANR